MKKVKENSKVFMIGSLGYSLIEILWRGFTHWTMVLTGGLCFTLLYHLNNKLKRKPLIRKCILGAGLITLVEFMVGCIVNLWLKWNVWDYSRCRFNLCGQICLLYSSLWFLLCMPLCFFTSFVKKKIWR